MARVWSLPPASPARPRRLIQSRPSPIESRFDEAKATQAACLLLQLRGGRMHYLKLLKLLYLADREALLRWGIPITWDRYVAMDQGPVPSNAYRLVVEDLPKPAWAKHISPPLGDYEIELRGEPAATDLLSPAEEQLLREVFAQYGGKNRWELVRIMHELPEWRDPRGSALPISIREILQGEGWTEAEIQAVLAELDSAQSGRDILSGRI